MVKKDNDSCGYAERNKCNKKKQTIFSADDNKDIKIMVTDVSVVKGGIFSAEKIYLLLEISPLNIVIKRELKDIIWLYDIIKEEFPISYIPPLSLNNTNDNVKYIKKKIALFFNSLLKIKQIRNSLTLEFFFVSQNYDEFLSKRTKFNKEIELKNKRFNINNINFDSFKNKFITDSVFNYINSDNGVVDISINKYINKFFIIIKDKCVNYKKEITNILTKCSNISNLFNSLKDNIDDLSKAIKSLNNKRNISNYDYNLKFNIEENIIVNIENSLKNWGFFIQKERSNFNKYFLIFFKNKIEEINKIQELYKKRNSWTQEYYNIKDYLLDKKNSYIIGNNPQYLKEVESQVKKYNLSIDNISKKTFKKFIFKDDTHVTNLYSKFYAYVNYSIFMECNNYLEYSINNFTDNYCKYSDKQVKVLSSKIIIWEKLKNNLNFNKNILKNEGSFEYNC